MTSVLVLFAHPSVEISRANRVLRRSIEAVPGVRVHDLYAAYPDFFIDVAKEQALLLEHHALVFQHPFYWYSCPPLLKEWMDRVLEHGFAYGEGGNKLHGLHFQQAVTTAAPQARYRHDGLNHFTMTQLLRPFEQSAHLCGWITHAPFVIHGVQSLSDEALAQRASEYKALLEAMAAGRFPPVANSFGGD